MNSLLQLQERLAPLLGALGRAYGLAMRARSRLYALGLLPTWTPHRPCVSVGNIGWGGAGKTPLAGWLLSWAETRGLSPALLSRGYGAQPPILPLVVRPHDHPADCGDEPLLLARQHPEAHVVVDPRRRRSGPYAETMFAPGLIVLDDGFQHLAARRDADLVLLRPRDLTTEWGRVFPQGSWREPPEALGRATAFLIKAGPEEFAALAPRIEARLSGFGRPVFSFFLTARGLRRADGPERRPHLKGRPYLLVSGVGEPDQVEQTATGLLGRAPAEHVRFPDHHPFGPAEAADLRRRALALACEDVVCTPKDAVKLGPLAGDWLWTFELELTFRERLWSPTPFPLWWDALFKSLAAARSGQR